MSQEEGGRRFQCDRLTYDHRLTVRWVSLVWVDTRKQNLSVRPNSDPNRRSMNRTWTSKQKTTQNPGSDQNHEKELNLPPLKGVTAGKNKQALSKKVHLIN